MTPLSLIYLVALLACVYLAVMAVARNPRAPLNWLCAGFLLCFALWSFEDVFHNLYPRVSEAQAILYGNIGSIGGYSFASLFLAFVMSLVNPKGVRRWWPFHILLAGIPLAFIIGQWTGVAALKLGPGRYGWVVDWDRSSPILAVAYYAYYAGFIVVGLVLLIRHARRARRRRERMQALVMAAATVVTLVLATLTDVVLPRLTALQPPELGGAFSIIWAAGLYIGITRYGLLSLTAETAANEILAAMRDSLFLLSPEGIIVTTRRAPGRGTVRPA